MRIILLVPFITAALAALPLAPLPRGAIDLRTTAPELVPRQCGTICNGCRGCTIDGGCLGPCVPTCERALDKPSVGC